MSSEQATWDDLNVAREEPPDILEGARYGRTRERPAPRDTTTFECLGCGRGLSRDVGRVVGDNQGCTPVCKECYSPGEGKGMHSDNDVLAVLHARRSGYGGDV